MQELAQAEAVRGIGRGKVSPPHVSAPPPQAESSDPSSSNSIRGSRLSPTEVGRVARAVEVTYSFTIRSINALIPQRKLRFPVGS
jgi:hypothetical protein